jgi:AcrR family transcriptional regulator
MIRIIARKPPVRRKPTRDRTEEPARMAAQTAANEELSPAERRRRKVRDAIIGAAEDIFMEDGEAGISMRRIAERIDYSPAALYKYFDSKEALFEEIREQFFERLYSRMLAADRPVKDGPRLTPECMRAYVETGLEQPSHYKLAFTGGWRAEHSVEEGTYGFAAAEHLEAMITDSIAAGWFRDVDPELAAASVWAGAHGLTMLAVTIPDFPHGRPDCSHLTLDDVIDFHAEQVLRGLATPKLIAQLDAAAGR